MKLSDTRIQTAGVIRCCLESIGDGYAPDEELEIGFTSECKHCKQQFKLVKEFPHATWFPTWQIDSPLLRKKHVRKNARS